MGRKFMSKDEDFMSCYSISSPNRAGLSSGPGSDAATCGVSHWGELFGKYRFKRISTDTVRSPALCYNIRYFERHGRELEDPWSCRQSAIHHTFSPTSKQSTWVIIQPPEAFNVVLHSKRHPLSLHTRYITTGLANWRDYLDTFAQRFKTFVEYSPHYETQSVNSNDHVCRYYLQNQHIAMPNPYQKFRIDFSHEQKLQDCRGKLSHALNILTNMKDTLGLIGDHSKAMVHSKSIPEAEHTDFERDLDNLSRDIRCYIRTSKKLLQMSDDLKSMASSPTCNILQMISDIQFV